MVPGDRPGDEVHVAVAVDVAHRDRHPAVVEAGEAPARHREVPRAVVVEHERVAVDGQQQAQVPVAVEVREVEPVGPGGQCLTPARTPT
jgi:hypothetical protein